MEYEKVIAWVTKYALTEGIQLLEGNVRHEISFWPDAIHPGFFGKDWHRTPESALAMAEEMRLAKIESLKKSIKRLEALQFSAPTVERVEAEQEAKKTAEWRRFAERLELIRLQCSGMYYWQLDEVLCAIEELLAKWAGEQ